MLTMYVRYVSLLPPIIGLEIAYRMFSFLPAIFFLPFLLQILVLKKISPIRTPGMMTSSRKDPKATDKKTPTSTQKI